MGTTVLDPGPAPAATVHLYAQCTKNHPSSVTILALNLNRTDPQTLKLPTPSSRYTLTAPTLQSGTAQLNGHDLALSPTGDLPTLTGLPTAKGAVTLPPGEHHLPDPGRRKQPILQVARFCYFQGPLPAATSLCTV